MYCTQCGNPISDDQHFCTACGAPSFQQPVPPGAKETKKGRFWVPILLLILMAVVGIGAFYAYRDYSDPQMPWFSLRNGVLTFDESLYDGTSTLTVPQTIADQPIQELTDYCFYGAVGITEVVLPQGIKRIGNYAFVQMPDLKSVKIPEGVTYIGHAVFYDCENLQAISLPGSLSSVGLELFTECPNLKYIFFNGTAQQWENLSIQTLPENTKIYLVNGQSYEEYAPS